MAISAVRNTTAEKNSGAKKSTKAVAKVAAKTAAKPTAKPTVKPTVKAKRKSPVAAVAGAASERIKPVRVSFKMPPADFKLIDIMKQRALEFARPTKKSELLRAGLQVLHGMDALALRQVLEALAPSKTIRPK